MGMGVALVWVGVLMNCGGGWVGGWVGDKGSGNGGKCGGDGGDGGEGEGAAKNGAAKNERMRRWWLLRLRLRQQR